MTSIKRFTCIAAIAIASTVSIFAAVAKADPAVVTSSAHAGTPCATVVSTPSGTSTYVGDPWVTVTKDGLLKALVCHATLQSGDPVWLVQHTNGINFTFAGRVVTLTVTSQ
ncbi:MAG TPA: hypothetical protein VF101_09170 [Gaiellaceae bacterium]